MLCHIPEILRARPDPSAVSPFVGVAGCRLCPSTLIYRSSINFCVKVYTVFSEMSTVFYQNPHK